jgi:sugar phosphate permease
VSLFMDTSSEMIHSLMPLYLTTVLGAPVMLVGLMEGLAEATAAATRIFPGALADWTGRRKALALMGYGLAAAVKPVFPLAASVAWVTGARVLDRVGKGVRGAPRDTLVAEFTPPALRGAAFGLRQALDTVGAVLGPALALGLLTLGVLDLRGVLWLAVVPAVAAVVVLALAVREPPQAAGRCASPCTDGS